jgi:hypothetical protein
LKTEKIMRKDAIRCKKRVSAILEGTINGRTEGEISTLWAIPARKVYGFENLRTVSWEYKLMDNRV